jgi:ADP-ribose pyrophosphatase YjhB (NUDIX family)
MLVKNVKNMKDYFKFIPAVYLVLKKDNQILLLQRQNTGYMDGYWSLPAGHHDGGQTLKEAMCREAKEEAGVNIQPEDLTFIHVMHRHQANDGERIDFFFGCTSWTGSITNAEPHKCSALTWFSPDALPSNLVPSVKHALQHIAAQEMYSEEDQET